MLGTVTGHTLTPAAGFLVGEAMDDQGRRAHTDACEAQYLGDYTGQRGALGDFLGYLQSLYPQGCEHQLLLGTRGGGGGREVGEEGMDRMGEVRGGEDGFKHRLALTNTGHAPKHSSPPDE